MNCTEIEKLCKKATSDTTNHVYLSRKSFNTWSNFIADELNGLTIEQQMIATELDLSYTNIHLKGTRHLQGYRKTSTSD